MSNVKVGDQAPLLTLTTQTGETIRLGDFLGEKVVVLFFYPKDGTTVCTKEACAFRDAYDQFAEAGAVVIGISSDSAASHQSFAAKHGLPFYLASDPKNEARKAFGVPWSLGFLPGRVTYVIDKAGIVQLVFSGLLMADRHVSEALEAVRKLAGKN